MSTQALLAGLRTYQEQLKLHIAQLEQEFSEIELHWHHLNHVFSGDAADQFRVYWQRTIENFQEYLERAHRVEEMLEERIGYLDAYNRLSDKL